MKRRPILFLMDLNAQLQGDQGFSFPVTEGVGAVETQILGQNYAFSIVV